MKRKTALIILLCCLLLTLITIFYFLYKEQRIAVLTYHGVVEKVKDKNGVDISGEYFEKQMKWLSAHHYKTITMEEFYDWKKGKIKLPRKSVLITFDDGWKNTYENALPIMEKYHIKSNVFVVWKYYENCTLKGENTYVNKKDIQDIKKNHKSLKILSHSYDLHNHEDATSKNYTKYSNDIKMVKKFDKSIKYYAYPFGIHNKEYEKALKDGGYKLAFTFGPYEFASRQCNDFAVPRVGIFESTPFWKFKLKLFFKS